VDAVERGEESEIVIARNGKPAAKLVALGSSSRVPIRLGLHEGEYPPLSLEDFNALDEDVASLFGVKPK
jgi:antitoxin (DNA-binding transcriptional repressor) of toxin-antitoxin stability system